MVRPANRVCIALTMQTAIIENIKKIRTSFFILGRGRKKKREKKERKRNPKICICRNRKDRIQEYGEK